MVVVLALVPLLRYRPPITPQFTFLNRSLLEFNFQCHQLKLAQRDFIDSHALYYAPKMDSLFLVLWEWKQSQRERDGKGKSPLISPWQFSRINRRMDQTEWMEVQVPIQYQCHPGLIWSGLIKFCSSRWPISRVPLCTSIAKAEGLSGTKSKYDILMVAVDVVAVEVVVVVVVVFKRAVVAWLLTITLMRMTKGHFYLLSLALISNDGSVQIFHTYSKAKRIFE